MKIIIVDDEQAARNQAKILISELFMDLHVCDEVATLTDAYESILRHNPDLVLLDIDLPDGNAFDLLKRFTQISFNVIFITAFEQFALQAIKFSALDYLLKPYTSGEFAEAIRKAIKKTESTNVQLQFSTLLQNVQTANNLTKLVLRTSDSIHIVPISDIIRLEADGAYTTFFFSNRQPIMVSKNLKEYSTILENNHFIRTHQSHLVNEKHVICFHKADGGSLGLSDLSRVPVASRFREKVIQQLEQI